MRATAVIVLIVSAVVAAPAAHGRETPGADVLLAACRQGPAPEDRTGVFAARMRAVPGTARMALRLRLQSRTGTGWRSVAAGALGRWEASEPGVATWVSEKRVERLGPGATWRVLARFRWLDAEGRVIARETHASAACRQPDLRPDLVATGVEVVPEPGGGARYVVGIGNLGRGPAPASQVQVTVAGGALVPVTAPALRPGRSGVVEVAGPACAPGARVTVRADAGEAIEEVREDDLLAATCATEPALD